jgi:hypothetical protein
MSIAIERVGSDERDPHSDVRYRRPHHCSRAVLPGPSVLVWRPIGFENYSKSSVSKIVLSSRILATSSVLFLQATSSILGSSNHCMQCQCAEVEIPSLRDRTMWGPVGHLLDYTQHVQVNDEDICSQTAASFDSKQPSCDPVEFCLDHTTIVAMQFGRGAQMAPICRQPRCTISSTAPSSETFNTLPTTFIPPELTPFINNDISVC